jgi:hypothetical protein
MSRQKDEVRSMRVRLDGYLKPGMDPEVDKVLAWLAGLPPRTKFPSVIARLIGGGLIEAMQVDDDELAMQVAAAKDIMANFVVD